MRLFPVRIEHPLDLPVERPHDPDLGEHCRPTKLRDQEQSFHRGLPVRRVVFGLGQLGDELCGVP
jgi:hypothetical protein